MKKVQKINLEKIRRELISEIIKRRYNKKLDTNTAFGFIETVNDAQYEDLNNWVIGATIHNVMLADYVINGIPMPF